MKGEDYSEIRQVFLPLKQKCAGRGEQATRTLGEGGGGREPARAALRAGTARGPLGGCCGRVRWNVADPATSGWVFRNGGWPREPGLPSPASHTASRLTLAQACPAPEPAGLRPSVQPAHSPPPASAERQVGLLQQQLKDPSEEQPRPLGPSTS